ncbi:MAG TPA: hypothetical protein VHM90_16915 [Phycisphaerae bacterium]|nr:hypothetical protein [Phycisphaerae bacterium]
MRTLTRRSLAACFALAVAGACIAQDQPAAPQGPVVVMRYSVSSVDNVNKLIAELGIPFPMDIKSQLESAPFLAPGSLATDRPMGMVIVAGDPHKITPFQDSMAIVVPVNAGKSTPEALTAAGATPIQDQKDTFSMGGAPESFFLHRTAGNLIVKQMATSWGLSAIPDDVFTADYKDPSNFAVLSLNFEAMRKAAPEAYKSVAEDIASFPQMIAGMIGGGPAPAAGDSKPVLAVMDKINRITAAIAQDDANLHLRYFHSPSPLTAKSREMPRPAFPAGTFFQMHVVYPDAASAGFVEHQLAALPDDAFAAGMPPVYHERMKALVLKAAALNTKSDAISAGFALRDGHPVFYLVDQLSEQVDAGKELRDIFQEATGLATEGAGVKINLDATTYDAGANKVQHLVLAPDIAAAAAAGTPLPAVATVKITVDTVQVGKTFYMAISDNADGKYVADLPAAGMKGSSNVLCAGVLDLGEGFKAASDTGGMPGMTPDELQKLKQAFAGQAITWTVQSADAGYLVADLQIPKVAIKKMIAAVSGAPAGQEATPARPIGLP